MNTRRHRGRGYTRIGGEDTPAARKDRRGDQLQQEGTSAVGKDTTTAEKTMRDPQSNLVSMLQRWGNYPPPEFLYLSVSHFDTNRQTETCIVSRPANKPTNSGATKPDHRRLACDPWRPQCHVLWASLTYPWRERAKLMRGWAAAVDVGCRCVFLY